MGTEISASNWKDSGLKYYAVYFVLFQILVLLVFNFYSAHDLLALPNQPQESTGPAGPQSNPSSLQSNLPQGVGPAGPQSNPSSPQSNLPQSGPQGGPQAGGQGGIQGGPQAPGVQDGMVPPTPGQEVCNDGLDNDGDRFTDFLDTDCKEAISDKQRQILGPGGAIGVPEDLEAAGGENEDIGSTLSGVPAGPGAPKPEPEPSIAVSIIITNADGSSTSINPGDTLILGAQFQGLTSPLEETTLICEWNVDGSPLASARSCHRELNRPYSIPDEAVGGQEITLALFVFDSVAAPGREVARAENNIQIAQQEDCTNSRDDDGDGLDDATDPDCQFPGRPDREICYDRIDNDGDGFTDVFDSDCPISAVPVEVCGDLIDNDLDNSTDESPCVEPGEPTGQPPAVTEESLQPGQPAAPPVGQPTEELPVPPDTEQPPCPPGPGFQAMVRNPDTGVCEPLPVTARCPEGTVPRLVEGVSECVPVPGAPGPAEPVQEQPADDGSDDDNGGDGDGGDADNGDDGNNGDNGGNRNDDDGGDGDDGDNDDN